MINSSLNFGRLVLMDNSGGASPQDSFVHRQIPKPPPIELQRNHPNLRGRTLIPCPPKNRSRSLSPPLAPRIFAFPRPGGRTAVFTSAQRDGAQAERRPPSTVDGDIEDEIVKTPEKFRISAHKKSGKFNFQDSPPLEDLPPEVNFGDSFSDSEDVSEESFFGGCRDICNQAKSEPKNKRFYLETSRRAFPPQEPRSKRNPSRVSFLVDEPSTPSSTDGCT